MTTPLPPNFYLVNKPAGWKSFDVVGYVRKKIRENHSSTANKYFSERGVCLSQDETRCGNRCDRVESGVPTFLEGQASSQARKIFIGGAPKLKIGHAGTLDPFATGLLIIGVGRAATKQLDQFKNLPKTYVATVRLGATSTTGDATGVIIERGTWNVERDTNPEPSTATPKENTFSVLGRKKFFLERGAIPAAPSPEYIQKTLASFIGKQMQIPPMFSAKKIGGVRLYKLARQGKEVERQPSEIEILEIRLLEYSYPQLKIDVTCSAGTYIRTLAEDIGERLDTGAYCANLERTKIGEYSLADALEISRLDSIRS